MFACKYSTEKIYQTYFKSLQIAYNVYDKFYELLGLSDDVYTIPKPTSLFGNSL